MRVLTSCLALVYLLLLAVPAPAQRKPLTDDEERLVNQAINSGVAWLKRTQGPGGDWLRKDGGYTVGYTALPAMTLLECGVPPDDPQIVKAARLVRQQVEKLDGTYEVSLALLFLDRLNKPNDKKHIQTLATRLLSGQTITGGWGYKVPIPSAGEQKVILNALRKLDPPSAARVMRSQEPPVRDKSDIAPSPKKPDMKPNERPPEDRDSTPIRVASRRWHGCIREVDWTPDPDDAPPPPSEKPAKLTEVVPAHLRTLPIFFEGTPNLADPEKRSGEALAATTDNSNTKFALLALLAASRHDVVITRSMRLIVRRFQTSQNENGSWGYLYKNGGGVGETSAMTSVGLIGLAVGHGVTEKPLRKEKIDPAIVRGFKAMTPHIGTAVENGEPVGAMPNLYSLFAIERLAVLYDLDLIGNKDWYRWASQSLVAHQKPAGNWEEGGYPAAHPVLDTCFALLVLKRVNLIRTLGGRSSLDVRGLEKAINDPPAPKKDDSPKPAEVPPVQPTPSPPVPPPTPPTPPQAVTPPAPTPVMPQVPTPAPEPASSGSGWVLWVVLGLVGFLVLLALLAVVISLSRGSSSQDEEEEDEEDEEPDERPRRKAAPPPPARRRRR